MDAINSSDTAKRAWPLVSSRHGDGLARFLAASKREEIAYGPKGHEQKLDVYSQSGLANAPVFVFIHGGAWERGDKRNVNDLPAYAERNGFLLISAGYRFPPEADAAESGARMSPRSRPGLRTMPPRMAATRPRYIVWAASR